MPNVIGFNSRRKDKYNDLAALFGKNTAEEFAQKVEKLRTQVGVVSSIKEAGVTEDIWNEKARYTSRKCTKSPMYTIQSNKARSFRN